jgi:hypothetical protein
LNHEVLKFLEFRRLQRCDHHLEISLNAS